MLQKLSVKNVALISSVEIELTAGLNVLSGETGAGKSIVVDCLMLLFGNRYDKTLLRYGATEGYVEGVFLLSEKSRSMIADMGFECEDAAIIRRRFTSDGKSDIRVNGQSSTVGMLKRAAGSLIDIYGQHDFQQLGSLTTQLSILDYYDRHRQGEIRAKLTERYSKYREIKKELDNLGEGQDREKEIDYLKFQIAEIENSGVYEGEEDEILLARRRALNTEKLVSALTEAAEIANACSLGRAAYSLTKVQEFDKDFDDLVARLDSAAIEIDDIAAMIEQKLEAFSDDTDLDKLEERLAFLRNLGRKYGDYKKMTAFLSDAKERLYKLENCERLFSELTDSKNKVLKEVYALSVELSESRRAASSEFCELIKRELSVLGMENAEFKIMFSKLDGLENCEKKISKNGMDEIEFYFSANVGQPLMPLLKIISGGEMSRFMLALKVVSGGLDGIETQVFDEIDAGISGRVGQEVAKKLAAIATTSQVLCVTHLPQIAAMADNHLYVKKETVENQTLARIEKLDEKGIVGEISRLSGGVGISETSEQAAAEIRAWCKKFKESLK